MVVSFTIASFIIHPTKSATLKTETAGPYTVIPGQPVTINDISRTATPHLTDLRIRFHLDAYQLVTGQTLFTAGSNPIVLRAHISRTIAGNRYALLTIQPTTDHPATVTLIGHIVRGRTYFVYLHIATDGTISASVNGHPEFSYPIAGLSRPTMVPITVGATTPTSSFSGRISDFRVSSTEVRLLASNDLRQRLLSTLAGLSFASLAITMLIIAIDTPFARQKLGIRHERKKSPTRKLHRNYPVFCGLLLFVAGISVLNIITPPDNVILQPGGYQYIRSNGVGAGQTTSYYLANEPKLMASAASADVHVSFRLWLNSEPKQTTSLLTTVSDQRGVLFQLTPPGALVGSITGSGGGNLRGLSSYVLNPHLPLRKWVAVTISVQREQSFQFDVAGKQVQAWTWSLPVALATPVVFSITAPTVGVIQHATVATFLFREPPNRIHYTTIRIGQILAIIAIAVSVILLCNGLLHRLFPVNRSISRPIASLAFGIAGAGTLLNIGIDLLHIQRSNNIYYGRNSWLLSQYPRFSDFFQVLTTFRSLNPYGIQSGSYPPVGYWLLSPLIWFGQYPGLFILITVFLTFIIWWAYRSFASCFSLIPCLVILVALMFSLPVTFAVDRGNVDMILTIFLIFAIGALEQRRPLQSIAWISALAAAKVYPFLYFFLFLKRKRVRFIFLGIVVGAGATIAAFLGFQGSIVHNIDGLRHAEAALQSQLTNLPVAGIYYNVSISAWLGSIGYTLNGSSGAGSVMNFIRPFLLPCDALGVIALGCYLRWRETSLWRAVTLITLAFLLLSQLSNYYALLFLLIPLVLLIKYGHATKGEMIISLLFGLIISPKEYFYFGNFVDSSVLINAPLLIFLGMMVIREGAKERRSLGGPLVDLLPGVPDKTWAN